VLGVPEFLGHPLLKDGGIFATAASDLFFYWKPNQEAGLMRVHHPLARVDLDVSPSARFGGYPLVATQEGVVVADDTTHRFMALLTGQTEQRWHIEGENSLGVPTSNGTALYMGYGGLGAVNGVMAVDTLDGELLWTYAPNVVGPDPQDKIPVKSPKATLVPDIRYHPVSFTYRTGRAGQNRRELGGDTSVQKTIQGFRPEIVGMKQEIIEVPTQQPYAKDPFGHWSNSGLVVMDTRVYAEADGTVVSLDRSNGKVVWEYALPAQSIVHSLVGTKDHLLFSLSTSPGGKRAPVWEMAAKPVKKRKTYLIALNLKDGKEVWRMEMPRPGNLAVARGMLFYMDGALRVLGSAPESEEEYQTNGIAR
jgi:outer membrane protein assembly factor BamB